MAKFEISKQRGATMLEAGIIVALLATASVSTIATLSETLVYKINNSDIIVADQREGGGSDSSGGTGTVVTTCSKVRLCGEPTYGGGGSILP